MRCKVKQRRIQNTAKHLRWSFFVKIVNDFQLLIIFAKHSFLNTWQGSEYTSDKLVQS